MGNHALNSPSAAHRWMRCPGSIAACKDLPDTDSVYSLEGTLFHTLVANCLLDSVEPESYLGQELMGPRPNLGFDGIVTQEMVDNANICIGYVDTEWMAHPDTEMFIEIRVDPKIPECNGTMDIGLVNLTLRAIHAIDLKYGQGVTVEVRDNEQTRLYLIGLIELICGQEDMKHGHTVLWDDFKELKHSILQPRGRHPDGIFRSQTESVEDLRIFHREATQKQKESAEPDAPRIPGEKQCQFCDAKPTCAEAGQVGLEIANRIFGGGNRTDPGDLSDDEIKEIVDNAEWIVKSIAAVQDHLLQRILAGGEGLGYVAVEGQSKRTYGEDAEKTIKTLAGCGLKRSEVTKSVMQTPAQVEKVLKEHHKAKPPTARTEKAHWKKFESAVFKPKGKAKLVREDAPGKRIVTDPNALFDSVKDDLSDMTQ